MQTLEGCSNNQTQTTILHPSAVNLHTLQELGHACDCTFAEAPLAQQKAETLCSVRIEK